MARRTGGRLVATSIAALALACTGCGTNDDDPEVSSGEPAASDTPSAEPSETADSPTIAPSPTVPSPTAAESPTEESSSPAATASPSVGKGLAARLLPAADLPGFNDEFTWKAVGTRRSEGDEPFGTCHLVDLLSIGATKVAVRDYAPTQPDGSSTAGNLVASFADAKTAKRAFEVLRAWHGRCADQLGDYAQSDVGKLQDVPGTGPGAVGHWYLLTYGPAEGEQEAGYFDAQGMVRAGRTVSVLEMRLVGQDYNYRSGREPMVGAVRASAQRIG